LHELAVVATAARLPQDDELVAVPTDPAMPRGAAGEAPVPAFRSDPRLDAELPAHLRKRIDRFSALAYLAVVELLAAIPQADRPPRERIGTFLTNTRAGWSYGEPELGLLVREGPEAMHAYQATAWFPAAAQGELTIALDLRGCAKTTAGRASGFGEALWLARDALERGAVDLAIVGGVESLVNGFVLRDWPAGQPLPRTGVAEGAVVFALRRPSADDAVLLRDLRYAEPPSQPERDWVPTLSGAGRLHVVAAGDNTDPGKDVAVSLGGGYWITVHRYSTTTTKELT
jgi:hypothetical protein